MKEIPQPIYAVLIDQVITEETLLRLAGMWGPPVDVNGRPIPRQTLIQQLRDRIRRSNRTAVPVVVVPPCSGRYSNPVIQAPVLTVGFSPMPGIVIDRDDRDLLLETPVLDVPDPVFGILTSNRPGFDVRGKEESGIWMDACRRVGGVLQARFGFGDHEMSFVGPAPPDPRSRAWGVTYYGPALVEEIGWDLLRTAPAHKVERTPEGGVWLYLSEHPFVPSPEKEARRAAVEHHLRLAERFPNASPES